jgi:hypothetical protein
VKLTVLNRPRKLRRREFSRLILGLESRVEDSSVSETMDPAAVISALATKFGMNARNLNRLEEDMYHYIVQVIESDMVVVENYSTLGLDEDPDLDDEMDWGDEPVVIQNEPSSSQSSSSSTAAGSSQSSSSFQPSPSPTKTVSSVTEDDYKMAAYIFWTCADDGTPYDERGEARRKGTSVMNRFKQIHNMKVLYEFERRLQQPSFKKINECVLERFRAAVESSAIIHDRTIRLWAQQIRLLIDPEKTLNFEASDSWVYRFKKRNRIVNRAITHRVSKDWRARDANKQAEAEAFINHVRHIISAQNLSYLNVFNTDQSRFEKELRSYRTLRLKGTDKIRAAVGSVNATSHSYMIMPVISMDGEILRPMYLLLSEPGGKFPASKAADPPNIKSFAGKSANMNKEDLRSFYTEVMWPSMPADRRKVLLLLDSWSANKDDALSNVCVPAGVQFMKGLIPGGCTGLIQPLDVFFFRPYKSFVRFITDTVVDETGFKIWQRENILALQSFVLFQFSAPRFRNMIRYAFYKSGYTDVQPGAWISPHDFCFNRIEHDECYLCDELAFIRCAHCDRCICLAHAFHTSLHIDCT